MDTNILLISPPFTQLNTPYPAAPYLKGFLNSKNIRSYQVDLGLEVILKIFSKEGLTQIFQTTDNIDAPLSDNSKRILHNKDKYIHVIDHVISFLQGNNDMLSHRICSDHYLPRASRFDQADDLDWSFGNMGIRDRARYLSTLFLEDISDFMVENIDPHFGFSRYAERLSSSAFYFDSIYDELHEENSLIVEFQLHILKKHLQKEHPTLVALTVPFPGNLFSALKCGELIKKDYPHIKVCLGGGYANTELRSLSDPRIFEYLDFITLDDGEMPLYNIVEYIKGTRSIDTLKRTFVAIKNKVEFVDNSEDKDISFRQSVCPDYSDINVGQYISVIEVTNPMHRLWSDGFWNKLTMAHGCYWGRCTFCDTTLDYISRFEPATASAICNKMEEIINTTGHSGFHFVDEAAPPALMIGLAKEIIRRRLNVSWWTNVRFETSFTKDVCSLLKRSGCIAVSGGLEVASNRILSLINKGVSVEKVAQVCKNFTEAGILTHAYLMYGFPTQTTQETIDSLEVVRQLFEQQIIHSGFWHQFALTAHSPVGKNPGKFHVEIKHPETNPFANNDLEHIDPTGAHHQNFSAGLKKSLFNFMQDVGFDLPLQQWFDFKIPHTTLPYNLISKALDNNTQHTPSPNNKLIWIENIPTTRYYTRKKKNKTHEMCELTFFLSSETTHLNIKASLAKWILSLLEKCTIDNETQPTFHQVENDFIENNLGDFSIFWQSFTLKQLKQFGLLII
ncbi:B12-binding domain-containing radical SAM protein [Saccharicrinis fermentans]|uniref:Bacteriocin maturation radical SAM protein 1 n=1 Tax=Saccharicrinis fermentans DSM 9555 = JCM 21142 TaxID=869213 RepID=W7YQM0_9BACT|nr:radical SAM protein [Saccharicrinis fermentans]GAF04719.1 bacteriocin maturation radical SAM protein 1 [Saccharicrinis fermentans DSM 9555 = JCM 21142]